MANINWQSQNDVEYEQFLEACKPTDEAVKKAQTELTVIELLTELEVL